MTETVNNVVMPRLNEAAPTFTAKTTHGMTDWYFSKRKL